MPTRVIIIGDTHLSVFKNLPERILQYVKEADWVIHVGDFTSKSIVEGFIKLKADYFEGVYGNSDPLAIRKLLPPKNVIELSGIRIGIIHPGYGGKETFLKKRILKEFRDYNVNVIAYGHTHEANIQWIGKILLVNPGRGYIDEFSYTPATIALITIDKQIKAEIKEINL